MFYLRLVKVEREVLEVCSFYVYCVSSLHKVGYLQCRDMFGINSRVLYFTVRSVYRKCWLSDQLFTFFRRSSHLLHLTCYYRSTGYNNTSALSIQMKCQSPVADTKF